MKLEKEELNQAFRYCISLTHNEDDAYDLLQTGVEKFLKSDGVGSDRPKAYFYRILKNQFIDNKRRENRWRIEALEEDSKVVLFDPENLNDLWIHEEETEYILSLLPQNERELLYLWAVEGYTIQEIANQTQIPKGTLLSRLHRIKKKLRKQLDFKQAVNYS